MLVESVVTIFRIAPVVAEIEQPAADVLRNSCAGVPVIMVPDPDLASVERDAGLSASAAARRPRLGVRVRPVAGRPRGLQENEAPTRSKKAMLPLVSTRLLRIRGPDKV